MWFVDLESWFFVNVIIKLFLCICLSQKSLFNLSRFVFLSSCVFCFFMAFGTIELRGEVSNFLRFDFIIVQSKALFTIDYSSVEYIQIQYLDLFIAILFLVESWSLKA